MIVFYENEWERNILKYFREISSENIKICNSRTYLLTSVTHINTIVYCVIDNVIMLILSV